MGKFELAVDPVLGFGGQLLNGQFPGRQRDLAVVTVEGVAVNIDPLKVVVETNLLELLVGAQQGGIVRVFSAGNGSVDTLSRL